MDGFASGSGKYTTSLVLGSEGEIAGTDGSSSPLTNRLDRELLKSLRRRAQVIQTSVRTANAENYRMPEAKALALFSNVTVVQASNLLLGESRPVFFGAAVQPKEYMQEVRQPQPQPPPRSSTLTYSELISNLQLPSTTVVHSEFGLTGLRMTHRELSCVFLSTTPGSDPQSSGLSFLNQTHKISAEILISNLTLRRLDRSLGVAGSREQFSE